MVSVILLLLIPAIVFYSYSNRTSVQVVEQLIHNSTSKQLTFLSRQLDSSVNQLSEFAVNMMHDPNVREFMGYSFMRTDYEEVRLYASILEKLELYNISTAWPSETTVYSMLEQKALSASIMESFDPQQLKERVQGGAWVYRQEPQNGEDHFYFYAIVPAFYERFEDVHAIIEVKFPSSNIETLLDRFESVSDGQAFLFSREQGHIVSGTKADRTSHDQLRTILQQESLETSGNFRVRLAHASYELYYEKVPSLGWYIVDFVPVETILQPIRNNQFSFYVTMSLLLTVGAVLALILYRNVQYPIMLLIRNIERVKQGNYVTTQLHSSNDEFQYLFDRFNEMTMQIRQLFEKVYEESLRSRDATLKQLQSQINPHFLYNCLSFIMNMTKLKKHDEVVMMTYHLSQYYRYVTRMEKQTASLSTEIEFTKHYLKIIQMRFVQIEIEYDIPQALESVRIPKLIIQPLIENAVKHGFEKTGEPGLIRITAERSGSEIRIAVEDNGAGLSEEEIRVIESHMQEPLVEDIGTGLRNVHQRMSIHFGSDAGLKLLPSELGGLKAVLHWKEMEGDNGHD